MGHRQDTFAKKPGAGRRLYNWVLHWAETPYGAWALFLLAFAESSFFPIPPDVLLIALGLSIPTRSFRYGLICTLGSLVGGVAGYGIGWGLWQWVEPACIPYLFSQTSFDKVKGLYEQYDFWIVFIAAFTPIPYKVITITAGVCGINMVMFLIASTVGRAGRFFIVSTLMYFFGERIRNFIEKYFNMLSVGFVVALIGGFVLIGYWSAVAAHAWTVGLGVLSVGGFLVISCWPAIAGVFGRRFGRKQ